VEVAEVAVLDHAGIDVVEAGRVVEKFQGAGSICLPN
jgi:hypothetical protein